MFQRQIFHTWMIFDKNIIIGIKVLNRYKKKNLEYYFLVVSPTRTEIFTTWFNYGTEHYSQTSCERSAWFNYRTEHYSQTSCERTTWFNYWALIVADLHGKNFDACPQTLSVQFSFLSARVKGGSRIARRRERQHTNLQDFPPKNCMKLRKFWSVGGAPPPWDPPLRVRKIRQNNIWQHYIFHNCHKIPFVMDFKIPMNLFKRDHHMR